MQAEIRPEAELLIQICAFVCTAQVDRRTDELLSGQLDWSYIVKTSKHNGVVPMLSRWIALTSPEQVPAAIKREISFAAGANALHNAHLSGELVKIVGWFSKNEIDAIAVKGPVLAALAFGDVSMRTFTDLDLLVHRSDLTRAVEILVSGGYASTTTTDGGSARPDIFSAFPTSFEARRGAADVDVHWQVGPTRIRFFSDEDSLWARSVWIDFKGCRVRSFSLEDQVIYLCAHAAKHGWAALRMVCDLTGLIERNRGIDWDWITAEARRLHGLRMTLLGMHLARRLMQADIPEAIMRLAHQDSQVEALAAQIIPSMFVAPELELEPAHPEAMALRCMELRSDRIRYWFYRSITPTMGDWTFLPLPRLLYPAYFIIRPLRFALMPMRKAFAARADAKL